MTLEQDIPPTAAPLCPFDHHRAGLGEPDVWAAYEGARQAGPVAWTSAHGGYFVVSGFDEARTVLRDPDTFRSGKGHRVPMVGAARSIPIDNDPPLHTAYRALFTKALSQRRTAEMRPFLTATIEELVGDFATAGGGDFVAAIALPLPLRVLTALVGFSPETVEQLRELTEEMWTHVNESDYDSRNQHLIRVIHVEIERHRRHSIDDFLSTLLTAEIDGRQLTDDEITRILLTLAVAGHETTMNATANLMWLLAEDPQRQRQLREAPDQGHQFIEEMMRLRTPAQNFARRTRHDVKLGSVTIPADSAVLLSYAAANRDPRIHESPDAFDPDRPNRGHLGFGWGIHQCVGAGLARIEMKILLQTLSKFPPFSLAGEVEFRELQAGIHLGPARLPLAFEQ